MKTLVVAFDGLDKKLIEDFELKNIQQNEFQTINNQEGMTSIKTSELFASFITGKYHQEHGIKGLATWTNPKIGKLESAITKTKIGKKTGGLRKAVYESISSLNAKKVRYDKSFLKCATIFDKITNSRAMFVPSYNPSKYWAMGLDMAPLQYGYSARETAEMWDTREFEHRKKMLFRELESEIIPARDFLMCHFHRPDIHQHMYGDPSIDSYDKGKLRKLYEEIDELAENIKEKALEKGYERIIFMSDHGLPKGDEHNTNAFYSTNLNTFGEQKPGLVDFYSVFIEE